MCVRVKQSSSAHTLRIFKKVLAHAGCRHQSLLNVLGGPLVLGRLTAAVAVHDRPLRNIKSNRRHRYESIHAYRLNRGSDAKRKCNSSNSASSPAR